MIRRILARLGVTLLRFSPIRAGAVLSYHRVAPPERTRRRALVHTVDSGLFASQLRHLKSAYRVVPASQLNRAVRMRRRGQRFPVAITFDDDLRDHADTAVPLLKGAGLPATFFLSGAEPAGEPGYWWEYLDNAVSSGTVPPDLHLSVNAPAGDPHEIALQIRRLPRDQQERVRGALERSTSGTIERLDSSAIRDIASSGFEIGFHTLGHHELTQLDGAELQKALTRGREALGRLAEQPLDAIAYPHGAADERVGSAAREAGFEYGFTTAGSPVGDRTDPMLMPRLEPSDRSVGDQAWRLFRTLMSARRSPE